MAGNSINFLQDVLFQIYSYRRQLNRTAYLRNTEEPQQPKEDNEPSAKYLKASHPFHSAQRP